MKTTMIDSRPANSLASNLRAILFYAFILCLVTLQGCAVFAKVWPPFNRQIITATTEINPDATDRPSPVQIKVMQLSQRTTFDNLTFDQLFFEGPLLLSNSLISESSLVLQPGQQVTHTVSLQESVTHIAIIAAYRNLDQAQWKHVYPIDAFSHGTTHIKLDAKGIRPTDSFFSKTHLDNMNQQNNQATEPSPGVEELYIVEKDYNLEAIENADDTNKTQDKTSIDSPKINPDTLLPDQAPKEPKAKSIFGRQLQ